MTKVIKRVDPAETTKPITEKEENNIKISKKSKKERQKFEKYYSRSDISMETCKL